MKRFFVLVLIATGAALAQTASRGTSITLTGTDAKTKAAPPAGESGREQAVGNAVPTNNGVNVANLPINVKLPPYNAVGDGVSDDTAALQAALDYASAHQFPVIFPRGRYKYTKALNINSNTNLMGLGRNWATVLMPTGVRAFNIDGADKAGGWVFRIKISDMLIYGDKPGTDSEVVKINLAYNVEITNSWIYNVSNSANGLTVTNSNHIILRDDILYSLSTGGKTGMLFDGSVYPCSVQVIDPDIEAFYKAISVLGLAVVTISNPYVERSTIALYHSTASVGTAPAGSTTVLGGVFSSANGYGIHIGGPNLYIYGTNIQSWAGAGPGCCQVAALTSTSFSNIVLHLANSNNPVTSAKRIVDNNYANIRTVDGAGGSDIPGVHTGRINHEKVLVHDLATPIFSFKYAENLSATIKIVGSQGQMAFSQLFKLLFMFDSTLTKYKAAIAPDPFLKINSGATTTDPNVVLSSTCDASTCTLSATAIGVDAKVAFDLQYFQYVSGGLPDGYLLMILKK